MNQLIRKIDGVRFVWNQKAAQWEAGGELDNGYELWITVNNWSGRDKAFCRIRITQRHRGLELTASCHARSWVAAVRHNWLNLNDWWRKEIWVRQMGGTP